MASPWPYYLGGARHIAEACPQRRVLHCPSWEPTSPQRATMQRSFRTCFFHSAAWFRLIAETVPVGQCAGLERSTSEIHNSLAQNEENRGQTALEPWEYDSRPGLERVMHDRSSESSRALPLSFFLRHRLISFQRFILER